MQLLTLLIDALMLHAFSLINQGESC